MDVTRNNSQHANSVAAGNAMEAAKIPLLQAVLSLFQEKGNMTLDEAEVLSGMKHQTISPRISELRGDQKKVKRLGYGLLPTGETRDTRGGFAADVLRIATYDEWIEKANIYERQMVSVKKFQTRVLIEELRSRGITVLEPTS